MAKLSGGKELAMLNRLNPSMGALFARVIDTVNHGFTQAGIDPVGQASPPPPPNAVNVTVTGEMAHIRITDNNKTDRSRAYFSEVYADPERTQLLHVQEHGSSRDATVTLPTLDSAGTMKAFYVSSYSQTPGSPPSQPVSYPTYVTMDGATQGDMPQSAGSGTANTQGTQVAQGFGDFPTRKETGVKRTI